MTYDQIIWLTQLPTFLFYGVIGGIAGGVGAVLALPFRKQFATASSIIPIIFVAISSQVTSRVVLPKLDSMGFEAGFMKAVGDLPRQIDENTIYQSAGVYDDGMNYNFKITTDIEDKAAMRNSILESMGRMAECKQITSVPKRYASKAIFSYETNLGEIIISLKPSDCR